MPPPGETPAEAAARVLAQWQQCMTLADFQATGMAPAWARLGTQNSQTCTSCHAVGSNGFIATTQTEMFFEVIRNEKYLLLPFVTPDVTHGPAAAKMIVNDRLLSDVSSGAVPHAEHPRFSNPDNAGMTALRAFYDRTMQRITSGECGGAPIE